MAYSELVKNFNRIRDYMREFYIYGFKSREQYSRKSARSYDDEKRRLESWLGDYMQFRQSSEGKNVFLSIDSRLSVHNPLYKAWKAKSFTDGDITLHFILFDILHSPEVSLSLSQITEAIDRYLSPFSDPKTFDESTVRKKLKEYVSEGLVEVQKVGKTLFYHRAEDCSLPDADLLDYFSEVLPCGVIGSYLLDKLPEHESHFAFKHHYITGAMDSEILYALFTAIREKRSITMETVNRDRDRITENHVIPLKIMVSAQSGRQYLMAFTPRYRRITSFRTDNIVRVKLDEVSERHDHLQSILADMLPHMWGVSTQSQSGARMEHISFTIRYADDEQHIRRRLEREKRCGFVVHLDANTSKFTADVFDAGELMPWVRSYICRITDFYCSDKNLEAQFHSDLQHMYQMYGIGGGEQ